MIVNQFKNGILLFFLWTKAEAGQWIKLSYFWFTVFGFKINVFGTSRESLEQLMKDRIQEFDRIYM
jgi:hypothetical protein